MIRMNVGVVIAVSVLALAMGPVSARGDQPADRPNIVLIFIDDLGWGDVGCYGNDFVETPHIDRLASEGVRFTDGYAAGPVCSPSRCALQSGQNQARLGITAHIPGHWRPFERVITPRPRMALPLETWTVAEALQASGYRTGYIGKWHLGSGRPFQPDRQGYEFSAVIGGPHLPGRFRARNHNTSLPQPEPGQYRTEYEADLSVNFIREGGERPFFLMVSPYAVHIPLAAMSEKVEEYRRKAEVQNRALPHPVYAAMIEHVDDLVGRIVKAIDDEGLTGETMIVFTSDNGALQRRYDYRPEADDVVTDLKPLRGEKGSLYEGGIRVPLIVKFPAVAESGICHEPVTGYDLYPTFTQLAGASLPQHQTIDGVSLVPLLKEPSNRLEREALFWHFPHYHHSRPSSCIRAREWKLIEYLDGTGDVELFHLAGDIGETKNRVSDHPDKANQLKKRLASWRRQVVARNPIPNPHYDSERAGEWWSVRTGEPVKSDRRQRFPATEKDQ